MIRMEGRMRFATTVRVLVPALIISFAAGATPRFAVLEIVSPDVSREQAAFITDVIRRKALRALGKEYEIITRENLLVLLQASGKKLEECEGACEVDTGRLIGADLVVGGKMVRFGKTLNLILSLHSTHDGHLLSSAQASASGDLEGIPKAVAEACNELFAPLRGTGRIATRARPPARQRFELEVESAPDVIPVEF